MSFCLASLIYNIIRESYLRIQIITLTAKQKRNFPNLVSFQLKFIQKVLRTELELN